MINLYIMIGKTKKKKQLMLIKRLLKKLKKYSIRQSVNYMRDGDHTFIEVHKSSNSSLDYQNNGIYNSTNNTFNGVLAILSSTENECKKLSIH